MKRNMLILCAFLVLFVGCRSNLTTPATFNEEVNPQPTLHPTEESIPGLSENEIDALRSLEKVDNYPLYIMEFTGDSYQQTSNSDEILQRGFNQAVEDSWACSLFAALANEEDMLYGRNFDWEYSPALLLFTTPIDGYASVSMVDVAYLNFSDEDLLRLDELPLPDRTALLYAVWLPFDGMNEMGVVVGMAAVPPGNMTHDPEKITLGSLEIIRKILDEAKNVDEALEIFKHHNIDMRGGPDLHYLIADRSGRAVLVEFYSGEMYIIPNEKPWHLATNFLCSAVSGSLEGNCWRYDRILRNLENAQGILDLDEALSLLQEVAQPNTQWSVVYGINAGKVHVAMGQEYGTVHTYQLKIEEQ